MQKTFDQMLVDAGDVNLIDDLTPHVLIPANVVLEPNVHQGISRVRVTARDKDLNLLWGANISEGLLPTAHPTPVAIYGKLRELIRDNLPGKKVRHEFTSDSYIAIQFCVLRIQQLLNRCVTTTVSVKKKSDKTDELAAKVAEILFDSLRQINAELGEVGIKGETKPSDAEESL